MLNQNLTVKVYQSIISAIADLRTGSLVHNDDLRFGSLPNHDALRLE